jgi:hypothetical protein
MIPFADSEIANLNYRNLSPTERVRNDCKKGSSKIFKTEIIEFEVSEKVHGALLVVTAGPHSTFPQNSTTHSSFTRKREGVEE